MDQMENPYHLAKVVLQLALMENLYHPEKEAQVTLVLVDLADLLI